MVVPFYIPTNNVLEFYFLHILATLAFFFCFCFYNDDPKGMRSYLIVGLIWVSLMIADFEHVFVDYTFLIYETYS